MNIGDVAALITIAAAPIAAIWTLLVYRRNAIAANYRDIGRRWTNEGAMDYAPYCYVTLDLQLANGEIYGELRSSVAWDTPLGANVSVGWFWSDLSVSQLRGRNLLPVAMVRLRLTGNRNRLQWTLRGAGDDGHRLLPSRETLWPSRGAKQPPKSVAGAA